MSFLAQGGGGAPGHYCSVMPAAAAPQPLPRRRPRCGSRTHLLLFQITFYILVKAIYTLGYSVSLISLTTGSIILCLFR